jgi:sugar lactone lactonase YvrE
MPRSAHDKLEGDVVDRSSFQLITPNAIGASGRALRVLLDGLVYPEAPRYRDGTTWCVDGPLIRSITLDGDQRIFVRLPCPMVLGIQFYDQMLLAAAAHLRKIFIVGPDRRYELFADLSDTFKSPINEFLCHPGGSIYVGSMGFDPLKGDPPATSQMARIAANGSIARTGPQLLFANGMVFSRDARSIIVAESFAYRITRVQINEDGNLGEAQVFADLKPIGGRPDGICIDAEDAIWFADPHAGALVRVAEGGIELDRIDLPWPHATSCVLGGPDGRTLFFTATGHMPDLDQAPKYSGVLGAVTVNVPAYT